MGEWPWSWTEMKHAFTLEITTEQVVSNKQVVPFTCLRRVAEIYVLSR